MQRNPVPTSTDNQKQNFWLRLTAPPGAGQYETAADHRERERLRRSQLTSWTAPFVFFAPLLLLQQSGNAGTMTAIAVLMGTAILALVLNRAGKQMIAALLLVAAMDVVIEGTLLTAPGGLGAGWLLTFDLFVVPLIAVGVLLGRRFLWIFMFVHVACILGDFYFLPHTPDLVALIRQWNGPAIAFARPIIIQLGGGLLGFIEVRSTDQAIIRANRAELVAELQKEIEQDRQRIAEENRQLEAGVQEIVNILAQAANGHYTMRASLPRKSALWQIAASLNTLFTRLQTSKQNEAALRQLEPEILRLREALQATMRKQPAIWPLPSGGPLDPLIRDLRVAVGLEATPTSNAASTRTGSSGTQVRNPYPHQTQ